jgi:hypothetical protein
LPEDVQRTSQSQPQRRSNYLVGFLAVGVTWCPGLLHLLGVCYGPQGKATSDITYNPEDGSEAYNNPAVYSRLSEYTTMAHEVHGPDYDSRTEDIDGDVLKMVEGGKRHGRYWIVDGAIDSSSTPTPSQLRARSTRATSHKTSTGQLTSSDTTTPG